MRAISRFSGLFICTVALGAGTAAPVEFSPPAAAFVARVAAAVPAERALPVGADLQSAAKACSRPPRYRVALPGYDEARLLRLARQFGVSRQSGPVKKGQNYLVRGTPGEGVALFRPAKGMYRYYNIEREKTPLNHWGDGTLDTLRGQAAALIRALLGDRASTFAYANHETQWLEMKKAQVPHVSGVTLRYTRQVNGRHIVDNTAYIVVGFAGNNEVYLFEAVDPALTPVPVPRLVMTSATRTRMERNGARMSSFRKTVLPDGKVDIVRVVKVRVAGGCESYVKRTMAGEDFLVPAHSLACVLDLDNGTTGRKRVHLVLDASQATDADESMMEPVAPRR